MSTSKTSIVPVPSAVAPRTKVTVPANTVKAAPSTKVTVAVAPAVGTANHSQPTSTAIGTATHTVVAANTTQTAPKPKTTVTNPVTAIGINGHASYL